MKPVAIISGLLSCFLLSGPVRAQETTPAEDYDRKGVYVGLGFAYALEDFDLRDFERENDVTLSADHSPGFDVRAGYRFHPNFALEGDFQYFTGFDLNVDRAAGVKVDEKLGTLDTLAFTANAKGYVLTGRVQPYGLVGIGVIRGNFSPDQDHAESIDRKVFAARFGAGVDYYVTRNLLVNAEVTYLLAAQDYRFDDTQAAGVNGSIIPLTVGVQYRTDWVAR